jgi:subtilisin-like proprotein convertase family protein
MRRFRSLVGVTVAAAVLAALTAAPAGAQVFNSLGTIAIPKAPNTQGPANPYPSQITVGGLTGTISSVKVTLVGLSHTFPADVELLLVGPSGQNLTLMADVGGATDIANVNLVFDQAAAGLVPTPIVSGTYRPTNASPFSGPAPAPAAPYGTSLAIFNGTSPNGTWSLYAYDDAAGDKGALTGWSLDVTTNGPTLASFAPATGAPGTSVVLTGTNLTGTTAVSFAGTAAASFTVNSPTQITAVVPAGAASGPITVIGPNGNASTATSFQTTPAPTVTSASPASGKVGTAVTITGTSLTGATQLTFGGTPAVGFQVTSPTTITATVPTGAGSGPIGVVTPGGSATSATPFKISHPRRISANLSGSSSAKGAVSVTDGFDKCASGVQVNLKRQKKNGGWGQVGSARTQTNGTYSVGGTKNKAKYQAIAQQTTLSSGDVCLKATSSTFKRGG